MPFTIRRARRRPSGLALRLVLLIVVIGVQLPLSPARVAAEVAPPDHLVISEVVTGGASASDELIELYNPTAAPLPLEGLEVIYVTASGATLSRRAAWELGAPVVPAGGHVLVANQGGAFAPIADATYTSGMAATGGSVAIRILGAATPIDAVGWGTAVGPWLEGVATDAPGAGASIERLPGGTVGSWQDTGANATDFTEREVPEPQNLASTPTPAAEPPAPTPTPTAQPPTPEPPDSEPTPVATPPGPATVPIETARSLGNGTTASVEGIALTGSDFHDGGGFVADPSGGIAVLVTGGGFVRGDRIRLTGQVDDRFSQRTLRVEGGAIDVLDAATEPGPASVASGGVGEPVEGTLVRVDGTIAGTRTALTTGVAFDLDDGSGATRLVIGSSTGIDTSTWKAGTEVVLVGVVGQRDSSGSGSTGYRVMPRDAADVLNVSHPAATPTPGTSAGPSETPASADVLSIAAARAAPKQARLVVRGVVTLGSGIVDADTAVIQDETGAIVLRLGGEAGSLRAGQRIEASGTRSTKSGMETLRVTDPVRRLGSGSLPAASAIRSGDATEEHEARLIVVRGALVASARRAASGSSSFEIDDGSGPLKVAIGASLAADTRVLPAGTWVEVRGVLGQQTTGSKPREGYRLWPASLAAVRVVAPAGDGGSEGGAGAGGGTGSGTDATPPTADLGDLGSPELGDLRVGATLVVGPWRELGIGGLLWDGSSLVAVDSASAELVASVLGERRPPIALELGSLASSGVEPRTRVPLVRFSAGPGDVVSRDALVAAPRSKLAPAPAWVSVIGPLSQARGAPMLRLRGKLVRLELRCDDEEVADRGIVSVTGVALAGPPRLIVPCGGLRPVPVLATAGVAGDKVGAAATARRASDDGPVDARPLAAGLLLAAASGLAAVAIGRRICGGPGEPAGRQATPEPATDGDAEHEPPRLTLVRVPREHGP